MQWIKERVWQMGIGALVVLLGSLLIYLAAASEPANRALMWLGLGLIITGFLVPLLAKLFEAIQEARGEEGET